MKKHFVYHGGSAESHAKLGKWVGEHGQKGKDFLITMEENKPIRSNDQNALYWAILKIIAMEAGYTDTDELHEVCKLKFNSGMVVTKRGNHEIAARSTAKLNTREFTAYLNRVKHWAREEWGCLIPESPDQAFYSMVEDNWIKVAI